MWYSRSEVGVDIPEWRVGQPSGLTLFRELTSLRLYCRATCLHLPRGTLCVCMTQVGLTHAQLLPSGKPVCLVDTLLRWTRGQRRVGYTLLSMNCFHGGSVYPLRHTFEGWCSTRCFGPRTAPIHCCGDRCFRRWCGGQCLAARTGLQTSTRTVAQ